MKLRATFSDLIGQRGALHLSQICTQILSVAQYIPHQHSVGYTPLLRVLAMPKDPAENTSCRLIGPAVEKWASLAPDLLAVRLSSQAVFISWASPTPASRPLSRTRYRHADSGWQRRLADEVEIKHATGGGGILTACGPRMTAASLVDRRSSASAGHSATATWDRAFDSCFRRLKVDMEGKVQPDEKKTQHKRYDGSTTKTHSRLR
ncbi:hypothetical protein K458DRAFT_197973 [Lentithecium fluviatile CBS 122367]|uniref:Uncharacterized protein n=1 Tax=Lentithecium fluviatile CBS 122367 TaxID=1168545 RepID=A0A6G1ID45_9PLEO|nr:hypothetical protein K458DRAFT_197973 [Lentithecium fluviatile CBS 122367]